MQKFFDAMVVSVNSCVNEVEVRVRVITSVRLLLQQVVYGLIEWVGNKAPDPSLQPSRQLIDSLRQPTDGTLVEALESLLICAEQTGWSGISRLLVKSVVGRPAELICGQQPKNLMGLLRSLVHLRNDGGEGHGLVGGNMPKEEKDALVFLVSSLSVVLPKIKAGCNTVSIGVDADVIDAKFIKTWEGSPALIRKIKQLASDRVRAYCQVNDGQGFRREFNYDATNPFVGLQGKGLPALVEWPNGWFPKVFMPDRKTDSFTGRVSQLEELAEWYDDDGARACLVYGDGGFGKTTLAIEFAHRVLDEEITISWKPKIVIFYTAKRWQWGLNGLEPIMSGQPHLMELLANINVLLFGAFPTSDFYRLEFGSAVSQLQNKIKVDLGLDRSDIWLIVDNTETLISDDIESRAVGKELKEVTRRLGRVMLTSRRKEHLEASPVEVPVLTMDEAIKFVKDRSSHLKCSLGKNASNEDLRAAIDNLERRPIVLEAFVNALCDPAIRKIERATERVARMLNKDLGDFLFADVWARISQNERLVLLLMSRVGDVHQSYSLRICCEEFGVSVASMEKVLEESGGIASVVTVSGDIQISFSKNFIEFSKGKFIDLPNRPKSPTSSEVARATGKISTFVKNSIQFRSGLNDVAYRTPLAKAAFVARKEGDKDESFRLFEQAVGSDSMNGELRERFAQFLFSEKQDNEAALHQAKIAVELLPTNGEVWFMRGLIEARQGDVRASEISLDKAEELDIPWYRCSVQKCWAYLKAKPPQLPLAAKEISRLETYLQSQSVIKRESGEVELLKRRMSALKNKRNPKGS
ncbi:hypothetical protein VDG39_16700 [Xanthomonas campestris pv. raphani]|uniref:tetratricopeptide repeat protein n=1 Tax=Xanthomonas campestris TaxID=339 RepID=UPI002B236736|nr:hypothetical protein [Xanthomonas campestris]MEA9914325.1 hypothetical protein [Xanthomonas campestris pv. raphani]